MLKTVGIIFVAAVLAAGCATSNRSGEETETEAPRTPSPSVTTTTTTTSPAAQAMPQSNMDWPPHSANTRPAPVVRSNMPQPIFRPAPVFTWTSLNRWASECKFAAPRKIANSPVAEYSISSRNGTMVIAVGSREAEWNGIGVHLGFAPEIIDDQIFVHGLDLQKTFEPLMLLPPVTFNTNRTIVIDPGHGGVNGGTISVIDGEPEKKFTLDWAKRLVPLLEQEGWHVYLTRTEDIDVALSNRVSTAEMHHADLFISLHFNSAAPDKKQNGLETYCLTPIGMPSTLTRDYADPWFENLPNNAFDTQNVQIAMRVHAALLKVSTEEDRGIRRARFPGVLRGQKRPAILIEAGYLSNPHEAAKIEDPEFRQQLAEAVASALK